MPDCGVWAFMLLCPSLRGCLLRERDRLTCPTPSALPQYLACEGCLSVSRLAMAEAERLLRLSQRASSGLVLVPKAKIEVTCLRRRQDEARAAKLLQNLVRGDVGVGVVYRGALSQAMVLFLDENVQAFFCASESLLKDNTFPLLLLACIGFAASLSVAPSTLCFPSTASTAFTLWWVRRGRRCWRIGRESARMVPHRCSVPPGASLPASSTSP